MKVIGISSVIAGIIVLLEYFKVYSLGLPFDVYFIAAGLLAFVQILSLIMNFGSYEINKMSIIIPLVLLLPAIAFFADYYLVLGFGEAINLIVGLVLILEGLYMLH